MIVNIKARQIETAKELDLINEYIECKNRMDAIESILCDLQEDEDGYVAPSRVTNIGDRVSSTRVVGEPKGLKYSYIESSDRYGNMNYRASIYNGGTSLRGEWFSTQEEAGIDANNIMKQIGKVPTKGFNMVG